VVEPAAFSRMQQHPAYAFGASPFALLDAHSSLRLATDVAHKDDALYLAVACRYTSSNTTSCGATTAHENILPPCTRSSRVGGGDCECGTTKFPHIGTAGPDRDMATIVQLYDARSEYLSEVLHVLAF
jgi:hypothetical protein